MTPRFDRTAPALAALALTFTFQAGSVAAQEAGGTAAEGSLELLAERATRAVVLIDVRTPSDSRQGSGFLVDPSGVVLTNAHVIRDARSARVKLSSGDVYERVSILAEDARRDIAVLKIAGFDLPTLSMGNSDSVRIGAPVVLIGSPLGLENTVSTGIVSGRRQEPEGFQLLQLTAPASQGSSGGAVLGSDGRAVGIAVSQILQGQNLNFAVPINYARGMLQDLDREPRTVLEPTASVEAERPARPVASDEMVNRGLRFTTGGFRSIVLESREVLGEDLEKRTRITYRVIETVGESEPRIERYLESESTRATEPFGTQQTMRRERARALVRASTLEPLESTGEVEWWSEGGWKTARHQVRFEGDRVLGLIQDTTGQAIELDRMVPDGILFRDMRDLAFATVALDSLVGLSVDLTTFDPWTGAVTHDRYDVLGHETVEALGEDRPALRVNLASGLTNETVYFDDSKPRIPLRRISQDGVRVEQVTRVEVVPRADGGAPQLPGTGAWQLQRAPVASVRPDSFRRAARFTPILTMRR